MERLQRVGRQIHIKIMPVLLYMDRMETLKELSPDMEVMAILPLHQKMAQAFIML